MTVMLIDWFLHLIDWYGKYQKTEKQDNKPLVACSPSWAWTPPAYTTNLLLMSGPLLGSSPSLSPHKTLPLFLWSHSCADPNHCAHRVPGWTPFQCSGHRPARSWCHHLMALLLFPLISLCLWHWYENDCSLQTIFLSLQLIFVKIFVLCIRIHVWTRSTLMMSPTLNLLFIVRYK